MCRKHIVLPFASEAPYAACLDDLRQYRTFLAQQFAARPELFPVGFAQGYEFHAWYRLKKLALVLRRIKLPATQQVYTIRPSFVLPYGAGRTAEVEKALYLRQFGVPFEALAYVFGREASYWERLTLSLGRATVVGTTVKNATKLPAHLVADEKVTWLGGQEVCVTTTVGAGCVLGAGVASAVTAAALQVAYGEFQTEAQTLDAAYAPTTVCTDGFRATRLAWQQLFPTVQLILCFLHGVLKIVERCRGQLRATVLDRVWHCYHAPTPRHFAQRLRRLHEWAARQLTGAVQEMVEKLHTNRPHYQVAYAHPQAARTSNAVDRVLDTIDRQLYARRYLHGKSATARLVVRSLALQWNFHPYSTSLRRRAPTRHSPFHDLNGFVYHPNWLHNFFIAASLGGAKT